MEILCLPGLNSLFPSSFTTNIVMKFRENRMKKVLPDTGLFPISISFFSLLPSSFSSSHFPSLNLIALSPLVKVKPLTLFWKRRKFLLQVSVYNNNRDEFESRVEKRGWCKQHEKRTTRRADRDEKERMIILSSQFDPTLDPHYQWCVPVSWESKTIDNRCLDDAYERGKREEIQERGFGREGWEKHLCHTLCFSHSFPGEEKTTVERCRRKDMKEEAVFEVEGNSTVKPVILPLEWQWDSGGTPYSSWASRGKEHKWQRQTKGKEVSLSLLSPGLTVQLVFVCSLSQHFLLFSFSLSLSLSSRSFQDSKD